MLNHAKNNVRLEELRIVNKDSEKNSDLFVSARIIKILLDCLFEIIIES
jgi:hypothetical protein